MLMRAMSRRQQGAALFVALAMLVIMTLGAIAMVRSMDTTTLLAGNLSYRQSAAYSGDVGVEAALAWLSTANVNTLTCGAPGNPVSACPAGYRSNGGNDVDRPTAGQSWEAFWTANLAANAVNLTQDASGNRVSYFIHRLCAGAGGVTTFGANCVETPSVASAGGSSKRAGATAFQSSSQVYYRITVRVQGKKNTVSFVQAIVAL